MSKRLKLEYEIMKECLKLAKKAGINDSDAITACKMTIKDLIDGKIEVDDALIRMHKVFQIKPEILLQVMKKLHEKGVKIR